MKAARFEVTLDLLAKALKLPEGATILSVTGDIAQQTVKRTVTVLVEGALGMPDVLEGEDVPFVEPNEDDWGDLTWRRVLDE